ncbi:YncE family protein [Bacillus cereus group sp. Bce001]|uniref:YncE family protein n=1 Tax=Bacillus cereus group sp. Bce001 TaxID=3445260 RepID=UPI003F27034B
MNSYFSKQKKYCRRLYPAFPPAVPPEFRVLAYVTNSGGDSAADSVSVINTTTNTEIFPRIPVGDNPLGIAITPDGSRAYVTNLADNNVSVINTATNTEILPRIPVGDRPIRIAITPDGSRAYVTNLVDNNVSVINTITNIEIFPRIPVGDFPFAIAIATIPKFI